MSIIKTVISIARAEVGYLEKATNASLDDKTANAGRNNFTKYARDLDKTGLYNGPKNGYAWCDMFVDWCLMQAVGLEKMQKITYQPSGGAGAGCTYSAQYYRNNGRFFNNPLPGDQIFFTTDGGKTSNHTGLVVDVDNDRVYTIEGNTSSTAGVVENGGCVAEKSYSLWYSPIAGYGRPNYDKIETEEEYMDVKTFEGLWKEMRKGLQDNDSSDYSADARAWAEETGLMQGNGTTVDGKPNMMWEDLLTREQFITVLYRFAQAMGGV